MRNKDPLISIVIPVYNIEGYVLRCLESVGGQDYQNLEIIIVDDGSTDKSGEICGNFALSDKRVKVFRKENGGLSDARNFGIRKARGDIIALVDGDDFVRYDFISRMYNEMKKDEVVDIVVCGYDKQLPKSEVLNGKEATTRLLIEQDNTDVVAWNKLYKRRLFDEVMYPISEKHEDTLTTYKLLSLARKVRYVAEPLYYYVERSDSIVNTEKSEERLKYRERAAREAIGYFKDDKDLEKAAEVSMLLAKYAYVDAAVRGEINKEFCDRNLLWIKKHKNSFKGNSYITKKLRLYNLLVDLNLYKVFRRVV